jgi:uncharacterized protein (TIGR02099 family)
MTDPTPRPSHLLKLVAFVAPWVLGLVLGAWLLLGVAWVVLNGWIVPRIAEFRPRLEATAGQLLGTPVRIGSIAAKPGVLVPSFELHDVVLLDAQGRESLRLARVHAMLSPRSLARLGFEQLIVEGAMLDIRRTAAGRIVLAGIDISGDAHGGDSWAADWIFAQRELAVRQATVRWTDEQHGLEPVALEQAELVVRNSGRGHRIRLDATPPADWGQRFSLRALMRQSVLNPRRGNWRQWDGVVYADLPGMDLARLGPHLALDAGRDLALPAGHGALRVWADLVHGELRGGTLDVALQDASAQWRADLAPLAFTELGGRLVGKRLADGLELSTQQLRFTALDADHASLAWPGGDVALRYVPGEGRTSGQGELRADRIDLGALTEVARRLPLSPSLHAQLASLAPSGQIVQLAAHWTGPAEAPDSYRVQGRVEHLALAAGALAPAQPDHQHPIGRPGVQGVQGEFDLTEAAGKAALTITQGAMVFPGVFEEALVPLDRVDAELRWQHQGERLAVQVPQLRFANADGAGELQARWSSPEGPVVDGQPQGPGVLDLSGQLTRADATRVHRYLPLVLGDDVRHYVRDAVQQGQASSVQFKVKGDLDHFPYQNPQQGEFNITAQVKDVLYAYVPARLQDAGELPWPALTRLAGRLVFDRNSMQVREAKGRLAGMPGFAVTRVEADIADFSHTEIAVRAEGRGPLAEMLTTVASSPLAGMTQDALTQASATGAAELKLQLTLPLAELHTSRVQGSVLLAGNDLRIRPDASLLERSRGTVNFSETGFTLAGVQTRVFGGDARVEGGSQGHEVTLRLNGVATAEGLREAAELGLVARLAQQASGSTAYAAALHIQDETLAFQLDSNLQGLALNLPAPMTKSADAAWPLRVALAPQATTPRTDQVTVELAPLLSAQFVRDTSGPQARVLRGAIGLGLLPDESAPLPPSGVAANVRLDKVSLDAWQAVLEGLAPAATAGAAGATDSSFVPDRIALRAGELQFGGRRLHQLVVGGSRAGNTWHANVDAHELNGYVEYRHGTGDGPGRVYARLARLAIAPGAEEEVATLLDEQPTTVPALDVVIEDFELRGKKLGRLEMDAVNRGGAEWRLHKLHLAMPEADFSASGSWAAAAAGQARRTVMDFKLDMQDAGALLTRLAMPGVFRRGTGRLQGQVSWNGSPLSLDTASLGGQFHLDVQNGQFLKADAGAARLLGVLSMQSLPRRLTLDFRDVFSEGFAFDFVRGDVRIAQGQARTNNLQMKGISAAVLLDGSADIVRETQDIRVVVVPEINAGTASLVATVINPAIGVGTFLAQWLLRRPLMEAATQQFHIDGTWSDPRIERVARSGPAVMADEQPAGAPPPTGVTP